MTTAPTWSPVDEQTDSLLDLIADDGTLTTEAEWDLYTAILAGVAATAGGVINPNVLRLSIRGRIKPQRVGAFTHRALSQGLVEYTGEWVTSTDTHGRNSGKPARELRWLGGPGDRSRGGAAGLGGSLTTSLAGGAVQR